tara:strand:+ start:142 stop:456 length:315 start_codon:yes stop_codon:yes gene_type:complete
MEEFKAGDFTSGKMGKIFKGCFIGGSVTITHKQFGKSYLVSEELLRAAILNILMKHDAFESYISNEFCGDIQEYLKHDEDVQRRYISEFYKDSFTNWIEVLTAI